MKFEIHGNLMHITPDDTHRHTSHQLPLIRFDTLIDNIYSLKQLQFCQTQQTWQIFCVRLCTFHKHSLVIELAHLLLNYAFTLHLSVILCKNILMAIFPMNHHRGWQENASFLLTGHFAFKDKVVKVGFVLKMIKDIWQITH